MNTDGIPVMVSRENKALTAGDYDKAEAISTIPLPAVSAELETVGGPMSTQEEVLKLVRKHFDKVYVGSAEDAETAENAIAIANQVFDVLVKANNTGGTIAYDYLDKKTVFCIPFSRKDTWTEIQMTVSKQMALLSWIRLWLQESLK